MARIDRHGRNVRWTNGLVQLNHDMVFGLQVWGPKNEWLSFASLNAADQNQVRKNVSANPRLLPMEMAAIVR